MPLAAIGIGLGTAIAGGAAAGATVYGAHKAAASNREAADIGAQSQKDSSAAQTKSNEETLAFQKQQAENDYRNQELTRRANYDQYASGQNRFASLDSAVGLAPRQVPAYVPSQDPNFTGAPSAGQVLAGPAAAAAKGPAPAVNWTADPNTLGQQLTAYFASKGAPATEVPYWVSKAGELVARGKEINNPNYANERLAAADVFGGAAPTAKASAATYAAPYSVSSYLQQRQNPLPASLSGY